MKHGEEGTHWVCDARLAVEGGKATCCECTKHGCRENSQPESWEEEEVLDDLSKEK